MDTGTNIKHKLVFGFIISPKEASDMIKELDGTVEEEEGLGVKNIHVLKDIAYIDLGVVPLNDGVTVISPQVLEEGYNIVNNNFPKFLLERGFGFGEGDRKAKMFTVIGE